MKEKRRYYWVVILAVALLVAFAPGRCTWAVAEEKSVSEITKIVATKNSVNINWGSYEEATSYEICRKENNGDFKVLATVGKDTTSYLDTTVKTNVSYYYKVVCKTAEDSYNSKARKVTPKKIAAPSMNYVKRYSVDGKNYAKVEWKAIQDKTYYVYRKADGEKWKKIGSVTAKDNVCAYTDRTVASKTHYLYTVKRVDKIGEILYKYSDYEKGIATIDQKPVVKADSSNLRAVLSWKKVPHATNYKVYRKVGHNGAYRLIGETTKTNFKDVYKNTTKTKAEKKFLCAGHFVDPSIHPYVYTVRAHSEVKGKESYSDYLRDGDFHLETPAIVSVEVNGKEVEMEWSVQKTAQKYRMYGGAYDANKKFHWTLLKEVDAKNVVRQKEVAPLKGKYTHFTVKAAAMKNGEKVYSGYDKGFTVKNRKYDKTNILYIGDSITFGSPYKSKSTQEVFSYPWRMQQLLNCDIYNPSIPGATYAYKKNEDRHRLITDVAQPIRKGKTPVNALHTNKQKYKDFDVVVMAAGTNDYSDNIRFGALNSKNIKEFNGSLNTIMSYIKEGSEARVKAGKKPIKVVFVELFYSDRTKEYSKLTNRFVTKNGLGLTLVDYQKNLDKMMAKYKKEGVDIYKFDTTAFVNQKTCPYATSDNLHMSRYTYTQIGNKFAQFMVDKKIVK